VLSDIGATLPQRLDLDMKLVDDLALDSLTMLELTEVLGDLVPSLTTSDVLLASTASVRDVYLLYMQAMQMPTD
jgi:hypothetical protein